MSRSLQAEVASMLGDLGIAGVQFGSRTMKAARRSGIKALKGFGETIKVGDLVEVSQFDKQTQRWSTNDEPQRVDRLFKGSDGKPRIVYRTFDDGPIHSARSVPLAADLETVFYRLRFRKLTRQEVCGWYAKNRRLADGWHDLGGLLGRVLVEQGQPSQVVRAHADTQMAYAIERAAQLSGFDLVVSRVYADPAKTVAIVKTATRRIATYGRSPIVSTPQNR